MPSRTAIASTHTARVLPAARLAMLRDLALVTLVLVLVLITSGGAG